MGISNGKSKSKAWFGKLQRSLRTELSSSPRIGAMPMQLQMQGRLRWTRPGRASSTTRKIRGARRSSAEISTYPLDYEISNRILELGVQILFISLSDRVHWQGKRSVRKRSLCSRARRNNKRKDHDNELLQTPAAQDPVARDHWTCDDAVRLDAILQSAGSKPGALHRYGRRRCLPSNEASTEETPEGPDRN